MYSIRIPSFGFSHTQTAIVSTVVVEHKCIHTDLILLALLHHDLFVVGALGL